MNFFVKALLKKQLGTSVPPEQIDAIIAAIEKNPAFFEQMAEKVKAKMATGLSQEEAARSIIAESGDELKAALGK